MSWQMTSLVRFQPRLSFVLNCCDEETQNKGQIFIFIPTERLSVQISDLFSWLRTSEALPHKLACAHFLLPGGSQTGIGTTMDMYMGLLGKEVRAKVKFHRGTYQEKMYSLMTYGIPISAVESSWSEAGVVKTKSITDLMNMMRIRDTIGLQRREAVLIPLNSDILCGKGKPFQLHVGNLMMQNLVEELLGEYSERNKSGKTRLIQEIVQKLKDDRGSRFLSKDQGVWLEVADDVAVAKVSQLFRSRRLVNKSKGVASAGAEKRNRLASSTSESEGKRARHTSSDEEESEE